MRSRTRTFTAPTYCTVTGLVETFLDHATPSKLWKECHHSSKKVLAFQPASGTIVTVSAVGHPTVTQDITPSVRPFPGYTWQAGSWRGFVPEVLNEPPSAMELPKVNAAKVAMDLSRSSTNLAEFIATLKDTCSLFSVPGMFLKHAVKHGVRVSNRPLKELKGSLNAAGSTWLQGTYGYLPLISSLQELTAIARAPQKTLARLAKPVSQDIRHQTSRSYSSVPSPNLDQYSFGTNVRVHQTLQRLIRLDGQPNPSFQSMSIANQMATYLGLNDFGRLAWELVPFSFVVDWFTDLGSNIASASALNGPLAYSNLRVSSCMKTRTVSSYSVVGARTTSVKNLWFQNTATINLNGGMCVVENIDFHRSAYGEGDSSGSTFNNGLSAYRTATGLALLHGSTRKLTGW